MYVIKVKIKNLPLLKKTTADFDGVLKVIKKYANSEIDEIKVRRVEIK
jgi:hypothetical protein